LGDERRRQRPPGIGAVLDNRQGAPRWAPDGSAVYFTLQERGRIHLVRLPISGGKPEYVVKDIGGVGAGPWGGTDRWRTVSRHHKTRRSFISRQATAWRAS